LKKAEREKASVPPNDFYPNCYATAYTFSSITKKKKKDGKILKNLVENTGS